MRTTHTYKGIKIFKVYAYGYYYYRVKGEKYLHSTLRSAKLFVDEKLEEENKK